MERMTKRLEGDLPWVDEGAVQAVEGGYTGPAVEKLAKLEELCEMLAAQQVQLSGELETLRRAGKAKSHKFNELLGKKLTNSYFLGLLKVYGLDVDQGTEMNKAGAILGKVKLKFADGGGNWQTMRYDGMFSATVNGCNLTQVAPTGRFTVTDSMGGKLHSTVEQELRLSFPNEGWRYQYQNGAVAVLTITINGIPGVLYLVKRDGRYVATKIKPMN